MVKIIQTTAKILCDKPEIQNLSKKIVEDFQSENENTNNPCPNIPSLIHFAVKKSIFYFTKLLKSQLMAKDKQIKLKKKQSTYTHYKLRIMKK